MSGCGVPENVERWSLTLFRHGPQGLVDSLQDAEFRFGRFASEFDFCDRVARLPPALARLTEGTGLEADALEAGLMIDFSIKEIRDDPSGWFCMGMVAEGTEARGSIKRNRWAFSEPEGVESIEIVQVSPITGLEMPDRIWIKLSELPASSLIWAMDNGILEGESTAPDSGQQSISQWVGIESGVKLESDSPSAKEMVMPGQPHFSYVFGD